MHSTWIKGKEIKYIFVFASMYSNWKIPMFTFACLLFKLMKTWMIHKNKGKNNFQLSMPRSMSFTCLHTLSSRFCFFFPPDSSACPALNQKVVEGMWWNQVNPSWKSPVRGDGRKTKRNRGQSADCQTLRWVSAFCVQKSGSQGKQRRYAVLRASLLASDPSVSAFTFLFLSAFLPTPQWYFWLLCFL